jgi:hypothetical protein
MSAFSANILSIAVIKSKKYISETSGRHGTDEKACGKFSQENIEEENT